MDGGNWHPSCKDQEPLTLLAEWKCLQMEKQQKIEGPCGKNMGLGDAKSANTCFHPF